MRKRMIDPEIFDSADSKDWNTVDFTVMVAAICAADDEGRGRISQIKKSIISMISESKFQKSLKKLEDSISIYQKIYYFLPKFRNYQTISHPKPSKFPDPKLLEDKDLTQKTSINLVDSFQNHSILSKVSLKEVSLKEVKLAEASPTDNDQPSNFELPLPSLTQDKKTEPANYEDIFEVTDCVKNLLSIHCNINEPDKATLSSFVKMITTTPQVRNSTAFKLVRDTFLEFSELPDEKKNLKYVYSRAKGRINDGLIKRREELNKLQKQNEKKESTSVVNNDIEQLTSKFQIS